MDTHGTAVTDDLWEEFHRVVNMTSRELRHCAVRDADELTEPLPGQAAWRHKLMTIGRDPLKPVD